MEGRHMVDLTNDLKPAAVVKRPKRNKNKEKELPAYYKDDHHG